jgi:hypothetical protein
MFASAFKKSHFRTVRRFGGQTPSLQLVPQNVGIACYRRIGENSPPDSDTRMKHSYFS